MTGERGGVREGRTGGEVSRQDDSSFKLAPFPPTARLCLTDTAFMVSQVVDQLKQLAHRPNEQSRSRKYVLWGGWSDGVLVYKLTHM